MKGMNVAEQAHIVNILPPVDITGGKLSQRFHMKAHQHATIIIQVGVSAAAWTKIILNSATAASGGTSTAIPFVLYACETTTADVLAAREAILAAGRTPSAVDSIFYVIELDASELIDGAPWVELSLTNGSNSVLASAVAIVTGARHASAASPTIVS